MNRRAEAPFLNREDLESKPKAIERTPSRFESERAQTIRRYAEDRVAMRRQEAQKLVEAELRVGQNVGELIQKLTKKAQTLENKIDTLKNPDTQLEQNLELVREMLAQVQTKNEQTPAPEQKLEAPVLETGRANTTPGSSKPEAMGILGRLNRWLRSEGQPERPSLRQSAYDRTQHPDVRAAREEARTVSLGDIADNALRANTEALARNQQALTQLQEQAQKASFLTRWRYNGQIKELQNQMRFREAAIRARKAQLEKQQVSQEPAQDETQAA